MRPVLFIKSLLKRDDTFGQVFRFAITGGLATAVQYLFYLLGIWIDLPAEVATVVSYLISLAGNFFMSNFFTFRTRPNAKNAASFLTSHLINLTLQTVIVSLALRFMPEQYALIPAMLVCIPVNFVLVRFSLLSKRFH